MWGGTFEHVYSLAAEDRGSWFEVGILEEAGDGEDIWRWRDVFLDDLLSWWGTLRRRWPRHCQ